MVTDTTMGTRGNRERLAFLYDSRKLRLGGLTGELVFPPVKAKDDGGDTLYQPANQLARTPFMAGFKAGWSRFVLATVHILYGKSDANDPERVKEIQLLADQLKDRTTDPDSWSRNIIVLGDFNIFRTTDDTFKALTDAGFIVPEALQKLPSNATKTKHYDQIAFRISKDRLGFTDKAGVFDFFQTVFSLEDEEIYKPEMGKAYTTTSSGKPRKNPTNYYKTHWRTHQMSDHLPMWVELKINYSQRYLQRMLAKAQKNLS